MTLKIFSPLLFIFCYLGIYHAIIEESIPQETGRIHELRAYLDNPSDSMVLVVAHRADWRNAPENSLEAIRSAIEIGVDMIELDVRKTKDNQLVVIHDKTIDRTTNGKGKVTDWTLEELKKLNLKNGQGRVTRFKIPTLEEALLEAKGKVLVNLDKSYNYFDQVYEIMERTGTTNQVVMKAKKPYAVVKKEFGKYLDKVIFMPIVDLKDDNALEIIQEYIVSGTAVAFELVFKEDAMLTDEIIKEIKNAQKSLWINSLWDDLNGGHSDDLALSDKDNAYGWIVSKNANIIQTDRSELLLSFLKENQLRYTLDND